MGKRKIPEVLSLEEQKRLLQVFHKRYISSHRNRTMIKLMLDTGLRLSEVINLKWRHINLQTGQLKVVEGKGKKDRMLWIGTDTLNELRQWRERQNKDLGEVSYVFTNRNKGKLKSRDIREMVYKYADKTGIQEETEKHYRDDEGNILEETYKEKRVTPHTFRHTFATDLLRKTKNIRLVQEALGHSDLSTSMIYTHIVNDELENAMKTFRNDE